MLEKKQLKIQELIGGLSSVECKGCQRRFRFSLFKAHLQICKKQFKQIGIGESQGADSTLDIKVNRIEKGNEIFLTISFGGYEWEVKKSAYELEQFMNKTIAQKEGRKFEILKYGGKQEQSSQIREGL